MSGPVVTDVDHVDGLAHQESRRRFQTILESLEHIPVQGYDAERRVIYWNNASTIVYGYQRPEALGQRLEDLIIPTDMRDGVVAAVDAWLAGGEPIPNGELVLCDRWGGEVPVHSTHVMHATLDGSREMFCIDIDLRQRKRLEDERAQLEEQYRHAQKLEAVGRLAGGVAHDFNNLLQVMAGFTALACDDLPHDHPARASLARVTGAVDRATTLVGHLLTFSRRRELVMEEIDLDALVQGLLPMVRPMIGEDIILEHRRGQDLPPLRGDRGLLEHALMNLCVNARDAMPDGGVVVLETGVVDAGSEGPGAGDGSCVFLAVHDQGGGMDAAILARIYEPFFTTKAAGTGTGLGLAMVHGLVEQHGGCIRCQSAPGQGTTFTLLFPVGDRA
jgi:PAS domain S-box-containing protein